MYQILLLVYLPTKYPFDEIWVESHLRRPGRVSVAPARPWVLTSRHDFLGFDLGTWRPGDLGRGHAN
jgi:hypothetical protein